MKLWNKFQCCSFSCNQQSLPILSIFLVFLILSFFHNSLQCCLSFPMAMQGFHLSRQLFINCFDKLPSPFPFSNQKHHQGSRWDPTNGNEDWHLAEVCSTGRLSYYKGNQAVPALALTNSLFHSSAEISPWIWMIWETNFQDVATLRSFVDKRQNWMSGEPRVLFISTDPSATTQVTLPLSWYWAGVSKEKTRNGDIDFHPITA